MVQYLGHYFLVSTKYFEKKIHDCVLIDKFWYTRIVLKILTSRHKAWKMHDSAAVSKTITNLHPGHAKKTAKISPKTED